MSKIQLDNDGCIKLVGGIIAQVVEDLSNANKSIKNKAMEYVYHADFEYYCESLGASPEYIRKKIGLAERISVDKPHQIHKESPCIARGTLKQMTEGELKEYRSAYRKNRAKRLAMQKFDNRETAYIPNCPN